VRGGAALDLGRNGGGQRCAQLLKAEESRKEGRRERGGNTAHCVAEVTQKSW